jgi:hypothetical protein
MFRLQAELQVVSVFVFHDGLEDDPRGLVLKAVGVQGLGSSATSSVALIGAGTRWS